MDVETLIELLVAADKSTIMEAVLPDGTRLVDSSGNMTRSVQDAMFKMLGMAERGEIPLPPVREDTLDVASLIADAEVVNRTGKEQTPNYNRLAEIRGQKPLFSREGESAVSGDVFFGVGTDDNDLSPPDNRSGSPKDTSLWGKDTELLDKERRVARAAGGFNKGLKQDSLEGAVERIRKIDVENSRKPGGQQKPAAQIVREALGKNKNRFVNEYRQFLVVDRAKAGGDPLSGGVKQIEKSALEDLYLVAKSQETDSFKRLVANAPGPLTTEEAGLLRYVEKRPRQIVARFPEAPFNEPQVAVHGISGKETLKNKKGQVITGRVNPGDVAVVQSFEHAEPVSVLPENQQKAAAKPKPTVVGVLPEQTAQQTVKNVVPAETVKRKPKATTTIRSKAVPTKPELIALGRELGIPVKSADNKTTLLQKISSGLEGTRTSGYGGAVPTQGHSQTLRRMLVPNAHAVNPSAGLSTPMSAPMTGTMPIYGYPGVSEGIDVGEVALRKSPAPLPRSTATPPPLPRSTATPPPLPPGSLNSAGDNSTQARLVDAIADGDAKTVTPTTVANQKPAAAGGGTSGASRQAANDYAYGPTPPQRQAAGVSGDPAKRLVPADWKAKDNFAGKRPQSLRNMLFPGASQGSAAKPGFFARLFGPGKAAASKVATGGGKVFGHPLFLAASLSSPLWMPKLFGDNEERKEQQQSDARFSTLLERLQGPLALDAAQQGGGLMTALANQQGGMQRDAMRARLNAISAMPFQSRAGSPVVMGMQAAEVSPLYNRLATGDIDLNPENMGLRNDAADYIRNYQTTALTAATPPGMAGVSGQVVGTPEEEAARQQPPGLFDSFMGAASSGLGNLLFGAEVEAEEFKRAQEEELMRKRADYMGR